jgi:hypothetical protein
VSSIPGLVLNTGLREQEGDPCSEHVYTEDGAQRTVDGEMGPYPTGMPLSLQDALLQGASLQDASLRDATLSL